MAEEPVLGGGVSGLVSLRLPDAKTRGPLEVNTYFGTEVHSYCLGCWTREA